VNVGMWGCGKEAIYDQSLRMVINLISTRMPVKRRGKGLGRARLGFLSEGVAMPGLFRDVLAGWVSERTSGLKGS
jgi:hypothetical protein